MNSIIKQRGKAKNTNSYMHVLYTVGQLIIVLAGYQLESVMCFMWLQIKYFQFKNVLIWLWCNM